MKNFFYLFLLFLSCDFISFIPFIESAFGGLLRSIIVVFLFAYLLPTIINQKYYFKREYIFLLFTLLTCLLSSFLLYNQNPISSAKAELPYIFGMLFYPLAIKLKLKDTTIIKIVVCYSLLFTIIEMLQQLTYPPSYLFCGRIEDEKHAELEMRMGLWRFVLAGLNICMLGFFLIYSRLLNNGENRKNNLILFIILFVGIIFSVARKNIYICIFTIIVGIFSKSKGKQMRIGKLFFAFIVLGLIYVVYSSMTELNEQALNELDNDDFVRFLAMRYFLYDMNSSPLYYAFGAGIPSDESTLGQQITYMQEFWGYFQTDVGVIGYMSKVGLFGVIPYFLIVVKILSRHKCVDIGLLLFLMILLGICVFDFWGNRLQNIAAFFVYLYLVEFSIDRNANNNRNRIEKQSINLLG